MMSHPWSSRNPEIVWTMPGDSPQLRVRTCSAVAVSSDSSCTGLIKVRAVFIISAFQISTSAGGSHENSVLLLDAWLLRLLPGKIGLERRVAGQVGRTEAQDEPREAEQNEPDRRD